MYTKLLTILLAVLLDLVFGDPPNRTHPVALMGAWLSKGRKLVPQNHRFWFGAGWIMAGLLLFSLPWKGQNTAYALRTTHYFPRSAYYVMRIVLSAGLLKPMFAYRNLRRNVAAVGHALATADLPTARHITGWNLVSRDTRELSAEEVAGAAIESLAENLTDSLTAPLLAYSSGGLPAAWAYRFVNTADAMWGYRTAEFEQLGKFAARLDDVLNWFPARLTAWLIVFAAGLSGENARCAARVMLDQHRRTPSPNAGWTMSAMAGALGVTLSKRGTYQLVGGPREPGVADINRALRLADICVGLTVVIIWVGLVSLAYTFNKRTSFYHE
jgi:adenosylcobinamide-phosphate synthase